MPFFRIDFQKKISHFTWIPALLFFDLPGFRSTFSFFKFSIDDVFFFDILVVDFLPILLYNLEVFDFQTNQVLLNINHNKKTINKPLTKFQVSLPIFRKAKITNIYYGQIALSGVR